MSKIIVKNHNEFEKAIQKANKGDTIVWKDNNERFEEKCNLCGKIARTAPMPEGEICKECNSKISKETGWKKEKEPCVPVSEHEAFKEKVRMEIERKLKGGFNVPLDYARDPNHGSKGAIYGEGYCSALEELLKELGLNQSEHDSAESSVKKKAVGK